MARKHSDKLYNYPKNFARFWKAKSLIDKIFRKFGNVYNDRKIFVNFQCSQWTFAALVEVFGADQNLLCFFCSSQLYGFLSSVHSSCMRTCWKGKITRLFSITSNFTL